MSVFLSVVYPESLLIALSIGAVYHARRGEWMPAALLGSLAAFTRPFKGLIAALTEHATLVTRVGPYRVYRR